MLRGRTRVLSACQRCRKQKIKCSGSRPCRTCLSRGIRCHFGAEDKQVLISERTQLDRRSESRHDGETQLSPIRSIQSQFNACESHETSTVQPDTTSIVHDSTSQNTRNTSCEPSSSPPALDTTHTIGRFDVSNPLVPERPAYISETTGRLRWLGHSSSYAFTQQVLHMLEQNPSSNPSPEILLSSNGKTYKAESGRLMPLVFPDVSKLPSKGAALHYLQCVSFRTNPLFYLFDQNNFHARLQQFYENPSEYAQSALVWYVHFLVLIALGTALDPYGRMGGPSTLAVSPHFTRALQSIPDMTYLCDDFIESTELLCSIALYLQSIDHRQAAIIYMSQAVRMAQLYALHLDLDENVVGLDVVKRGRRLWWTVYTLNQKLTSNMGVPNIISEQDIRSPMPLASDVEEDNAAVAIHIKICQLLGTLINRVYSSSKEYQKSFVSTARKVLKGVATVADDLRQFSKNCFGDISRTAAHLELAFHQCIILTCRPALFHLLKLRLTDWPNSHNNRLTSSFTGLIQACVDSASQVAQVLLQLKTHNLLDTFLPFDLECGFSAAFVLVMAGQLHPKIVSQDHSIEIIKDIFTTIASWGNPQASLRRLEIEQLDESLHRRTQMLHEIRNTNQPHNDQSEALVSQLELWDQPQLGAPFFAEWTFDAGLSGHQIMNLADALDARDFDSFASWPPYDSPSQSGNLPFNF